MIIKLFCSRISLVFLISLFAAVGVGELRSTAQSAVPSAVNACIPQAQVARTELLATTQSKGVTYYLLTAYELNDPQGTDLIISLSGSRCREVFYNPMGDPISLSSVVEGNVARQLTLGRYRRELNRLGKKRFQQQINQSAAAAGGNVIWFDEQVWALRQLGVTVPRHVRVGQ